MGSSFNRLSRFWALAITLGLLAAPVAFAARQPSPAERNEFRHAIQMIESLGRNSAAVSLLRQKLAQGALLVEDAWTDGTQGLTNYPIRGAQTITIASQTIPDPEFRGYQGERGAPALWEERLWLASILVHEWLHTTQSWLYVRTNRWNVEPPAWRVQVRFLKAMLEHVRGQTLYEVRADSCVDRAQFSLDLATGAIRE